MAIRPFHKIYGIFRLGKDPEIRYTQGGMACASFSAASEYSYKKGDEWVKETEWTKFSLFGKQAERCGEVARKGSAVYVEGRLKTRSWETKEGETKYVTEVVVAKIDYLDNLRDQGDGDQAPPSYEDHKKGKGPSPKPEYAPKYHEDNDDDIPF